LAVAALLAVSAYTVVPGLRTLFAPPLAFEPIPDLPGFRSIAGGAVSSTGNSALIGLDQPDASPRQSGPDCSALFTTPRAVGIVPVAYFTDARCGWCRLMSPLLEDLAETEPVAITWHELPLLGQSSRVSARAALAAREQGAYAAFHHRLMGTPFVPTEEYLRRLAQDEGIDDEKLLRDMHSTRVDAQLSSTADLARQFGFYGTPGLVVGRTVVLGNTPRHQLTRLIATEREDASPGPCG